MKNLILFGLFIFAAQAMAELTMPNIFGTHMVLQADKPIKIWGKSAPNATIIATLGGNKVRATADAGGKWSVYFSPRKTSSTGTSITVSDGKNTLKFDDVLVGEVWFASGQSNMGRPLIATDRGKSAIAKADHPNIRFFKAEDAAQPAPQDNVEGEWKISTPVSVRDVSAVAYFFAHRLQQELGVPIGIVQAEWGGKPIEAFIRSDALKSIPEGRTKIANLEKAIASYDPVHAEKKYQQDLQRYKVQIDKWNALPKAEQKGKAPRKPRLRTDPRYNGKQPAAIWNGMIHPLVGYTIRGVIWYQGEANAHNVQKASEYGELFSLQIEDWRKQWGDNFSFFWVQLANFKEPVNEPGKSSGWATVQEHQRRTLRLPKTGMAVINEIGDAKDIHPRNKKDVGERLARWALADDYDKDIIKSGPLYKSDKINGGEVSVAFDHVGKGLKSRDGRSIKHFEIQNDAGKWYWANAKIDDNTVVISHPEVKQAAAVRYAWAANPQVANLTNSEGLPASLFTTELQLFKPE